MPSGVRVGGWHAEGRQMEEEEEEEEALVWSEPIQPAQANPAGSGN